MANKIQIRRGAAADLPTLDTGEPGFSTDNKRLWVGHPDGNVPVATNVYVDINGDLIWSGNGKTIKLATAGSYTLTIPATGTVALLETAQTFSAAQTFSDAITAPGMKPASDAVDAIKITDASGSNTLMAFDTTNQKVSLDAANIDLDSSGNLTIGGILAMQPRQIAAVLTASDAAADDNFGRSVSLSANASVLAVGAHGWEGAATNQGGVYIYDWSGGAWVQRGSVLTASDAAAGDYFGASVALSADGSILAVGAHGWEGAATNQGGVYIYDWSGGAWVQRGSVLTASDAAASDNFGISVSLSANASVLAVGAQGWEGAAANQGGVYTFAAVASGWPHHSALLRWQAAVAGTTKSTPGTVQKWLQLLIDGAIHYIPCYTSTTS